MEHEFSRLDLKILLKMSELKLKINYHSHHTQLKEIDEEASNLKYVLSGISKDQCYYGTYMIWTYLNFADVSVAVQKKKM